MSCDMGLCQHLSIEVFAEALVELDGEGACQRLHGGADRACVCIEAERGGTRTDAIVRDPDLVRGAQCHAVALRELDDTRIYLPVMRLWTR